MDKLSELLPVPNVSEVTFPEQPVHNSITDRKNAVDLIIKFFIIRSYNRAEVYYIVTYYTKNVNKKAIYNIWLF